MLIADIIPEKRTGVDRESYSYLVPAEFFDQIKIGSIVSIPFGKKKIRGAVAALQDSDPSAFEYQMREVSAVTRFRLPAAYLKIAGWISAYYFCSLGEAISLFLPPMPVRAQKAISSKKPWQKTERKELSPKQTEVFLSLSAKLESAEKKPALILGVTSSGKTEIYIKLAEEILKKGKQAIVLVPEIILTPQSVERFSAVFQDKITLIHSELSRSERLRNYEDFYDGRKPLLIGPRSALLVPSEKIGLIIVDEEEDGSYKQEKNPKYNAGRLAIEIARETGALLVFGSATPTVETFYRARLGEFDLYELPSRWGEKPMPEARVVDLKEELRAGNYSPLSAALREGIAETLKNHRQVFLFLNRRGAATFVSCRECGEIILCPNCSIPLVYHFSVGESAPGRLNCHHCDFESLVPARCGACGGCKIKHFGAGIEKIEREIKALYKSARIKRIDSKILGVKEAYHTLYDDLIKSKIDILIGTQIIAKGLDIPTVDLVGVISADVGLHLPYYKAEERTFQILTQVSGRSGRGEAGGRTIIQSYWPESRAIAAAAQHNYRLFFDREIENRKAFLDPPFTRLVRVVAEDIHREKAKKAIEAIAAAAKERRLQFIGPAKAFFPRLRGKHRYHLIFKVPFLPNQNLTEIYKKNPYLFWDADPENLL